MEAFLLSYFLILVLPSSRSEGGTSPGVEGGSPGPQPPGRVGEGGRGAGTCLQGAGLEVGVGVGQKRPVGVSGCVSPSSSFLGPPMRVYGEEGLRLTSCHAGSTGGPSQLEPQCPTNVSGSGASSRASGPEGGQGTGVGAPVQVESCQAPAPRACALRSGSRPHF